MPSKGSVLASPARSPHPLFFLTFSAGMGKEADLSQAVGMPAEPSPDMGSWRSYKPPFSEAPGGCWEGMGGEPPSHAPPLRHRLPRGQHYKPWGRGREGDLGGGWGRGVLCGSGSHTTEKPVSGGSLPRGREFGAWCVCPWWCRRKEGIAGGLAVGAAWPALRFIRISVCHLGDTGGQANTFQSNHGLIGDFWLPRCWSS